MTSLYNKKGFISVLFSMQLSYLFCYCNTIINAHIRMQISTVYPVCTDWVLKGVRPGVQKEVA